MQPLKITLEIKLTRILVLLSLSLSELMVLLLLRIHQRYRDLNTDLIPEDFTELDVQPKLKYKFLQQLPELKVRQTLNHQ